MEAFSIRFRLTVWYATIFAVTFAGLAGGVWLAVQHSIRSVVDKDLRSRLEAMRHYVDQQMREGDDSHLRRELSEDADVASADSSVRIVSTKGTWIYRSPETEAWDQKVPRREDLPTDGKTTTIVVRGQRIRVLSAPLPIGVVQVGVSLDQFREMVGLLMWMMFLGSPLLLLLASAAGYWMSSRALRPVDQLATTARNISAQNLTQRLPSRGTADELDRLSDTLNGMLTRLNSAFAKITQFTADASHELRTPVAIIRTTAEITCAKTRTVEEHEKAWDVILTQATRMSQLIDDLLMLVRADSGSQSFSRERIDLAAILRETCDEMQLIAEASGLQLITRISQECPMVGDPDGIRRVFLILLDNAIKYTHPTGRVAVDLELHGSAKGGTAVVKVSDTGVGISEEDLPHIFERFYRAAKDRSRKTGGTGLGLTIARYLAERHGGRIQVESEPGAGSTFCLFFPI